MKLGPHIKLMNKEVHVIINVIIAALVIWREAQIYYHYPLEFEMYTCTSSTLEL